MLHTRLLGIGSHGAACSGPGLPLLEANGTHATAPHNQGFSIVTAGMDRLQLVTHEQHLQQLRMGVCAGSESAAPGLDAGIAEAEADNDAAGASGGLAEPAAVPQPLDEAGRRELQRAVVEAPAGSDQASGGPLLIDNDLRLAGCVTWVGRSSLEVTIELADRPAAPSGAGAAGAGQGDWRRRGVAHFILVARLDPAASGGMSMVPLAPVTPQEAELAAQGAARNEERRLKRAAEAAALQRQLGDGSSAGAEGGQDAALLQRLVARARQQQVEQWQQAHGRPSASGGGAEGAPAVVPMGTTALRTPVIMHHQDRNITNAVFGGHVRGALALGKGWLTSAVRVCGLLHLGFTRTPVKLTQCSPPRASRSCAAPTRPPTQRPRCTRASTQSRCP